MKRKLLTALFASALLATPALASNPDSLAAPQEPQTEGTELQMPETMEELWQMYLELLKKYNELQMAYNELNPNEEIGTEEESATLSEDPLLGTGSQLIYTYEGSGDSVVIGPTIDGPCIAHISTPGDRHFSVQAHYGDDEYDYDLLVNTSDPYEGYTLLEIPGEYTFEVSASASFSIEIYTLGETDATTFSGYGDYITPIFIPERIYEITTNGGHHFAVILHKQNGEWLDLLANTSDDNYSGTFLIKAPNPCFLEINSEREWIISPVE